MDIQRMLRHLAMTRRQVDHAFPRDALASIEQAIKESEAAHLGQVRFVVEGALDTAPLFSGQSARTRAINLFSMLRIWDTEHNSGVLIYVLLADRAVEIVADRGIHVKAGERAWVAICHQMEKAFKAGNFKAGAVAGIQAVSRQLADYFPAGAHDANDLSDRPLVV